MFFQLSPPRESANVIEVEGGGGEGTRSGRENIFLAVTGTHQIKLFFISLSVPFYIVDSGGREKKEIRNRISDFPRKRVDKTLV